MRTLLLLTLFSITLFARADGPLRSGPQINQRPGPYSSLVCVGSQRGTQHCFICETADKPAVIIFARNLTEPLGKLVHGLDKALTKNNDADLRTWVTFLADDQPSMDAKVVAWGKQHATGNVPLGVF